MRVPPCLSPEKGKRVHRPKGMGFFLELAEMRSLLTSYTEDTA